MNRNITRYLKRYTTDTTLINRLLVSTFIYINNIKVEKNSLIKSNIILPSDKDFSAVQDFTEYFNEGFGLEKLIQLFEFVISPEDKVVNGAVYTPSYIRSFIVEETCDKSHVAQDMKIADISCGCGGFLVDAALFLNKKFGSNFNAIFKNNIFGLDIKRYSIERTKLLLSLAAILNGEEDEEFEFNLYVGNALDFEWELQFDVIVGNPPYVSSRNIDDENKKHLAKWGVCASGHPDLYIPFFQIGLENLTTDGILGYITMNSFFKSVNGRALRKYFAEKSYHFEILDFGGSQVFSSKSTYTCICIIKKSESPFLQYFKLSKDDLKKKIIYEQINYFDLNAKSGWNLQNRSYVKKIESVGIPFENLFKTRNGIATLKNNVYIFTPFEEMDEYYILNDDTTYKIEKAICKDIINPNKLIEHDNLNAIKQKIIFPYYYEGENVKLYDEKNLMMQFPCAYYYLTTKRRVLSTRDKGVNNYENWYAYGRNQSLEKMPFKMFFPHISYKTPHFVISNDEDLLFHNGLAVVSDSEQELQFLRKLMGTELFWTYITNTSKPYGSGYYSLSRNYLKRFGVYQPSSDEMDYIINEEDTDLINNFFNEKYRLNEGL